MIDQMLVNSVIASERRQEVQEERRRIGRTEPYVNYLAAPQAHGAGGEMIFASLVEQRRQRQFFEQNLFS